ncbi:MAG: outer membrane lipoprotein LolB [Proteobacteria bacterium]|nr:outer membrane lipoprotein LolB [Pseudomonadota bacterium]
MNSSFRCCALLCAVLLTACAGTPPRPTANAPSFELAGRVAVRYQEKGFSSSLRWKQAAGRDEIWLTAPLGQTIAYLQADADGATITGADQRQYRAASIERYWVFGEAVPGAPPAAIERDAAGRIARLKQDDWQVVFNYAADAKRPSRLDIAGNDAEIRLVVDSLVREAP